MASPLSEISEHDFSLEATNINNARPQTLVHLDKSLTDVLFLADFGVSLPKPTQEPILEIEDEFIPSKLYAKNLKGTKIKRPLEWPNHSTVSGFPFIYKFNVEKISSGYIINRLIFIDWSNYETLISLNVHTAYCFVCQKYVVDNDTFYTSHVVDGSHKKSISECQLLQLHGLNMIRKFEDKVHCAICNIICYEDQLDLHLSSREHEKEFASASSIAKLNVKIITKKMANNSNTKAGQKKKNSPQSFENNNYIQSKYHDVTVEELTGKGAEPILPEFTYLYMETQFGYTKISVESWHTIMDDCRHFKYCFLCNKKLMDFEIINKHIKDASHINKLSSTGVLWVHGKNFIRKIRNDFHCGVCNVIIYYLSVEEHVQWDNHVKASDEKLVPSKRIKKMDHKKIKIMTPPFQKETNTNNDLLRNYAIDLHGIIEREQNENRTKPHKALLLLDETLKIKWDHWNSIAVMKNGFKCIMCQVFMNNVDDEAIVVKHTEQTSHKKSLTMFSREHMNDLFRIINNYLYHCVICNTEISRKGNIYEHLKGARHKDNVAAIEFDKYCEDVIVDHEPATITWSQCI